MNAIRGRLAPPILVALMLVVAGCGQDSGAEDANLGNANGGGDAGESVQATAAGPHWGEYMPV